MTMPGDSNNWRAGGVTIVTGTLLLAVFLSGCASPGGKSRFEREVVSEDVSIAVLRSETFSYLEHFTRKVEATADQIMAVTDDPGVKREALLWKIYAIPACLVAQDHPSPLVAYVDMWILTVQMREFFETGLAKDSFGDQQLIAILACRELELKADELAQVYFNDEGYARASVKVNGFAMDNPLDANGFDGPFSPKEIESVITGPDAGIFAVAQSLETEVQKIQIKMGYYADLLPRIARWQAELFAEDLLKNEILPILNDLRLGISEEREIILSDVNRQREETQEFAESQKQDVLKQITLEREALTADMERIIADSFNQIEELVQREHAILREFANQQRELTLDSIHEERKETVDQLAGIADSSVDRIYDKLWLVLIIVWFGVAGLIVVARILFSPKRRLKNDI